MVHGQSGQNEEWKGQTREGKKELTCSAGEICRSTPQLIHEAFLGVFVTGIFKGDQVSGKGSFESSPYIMDIKSFLYMLQIFLKEGRNSVPNSKA